MGHMGHMSCFLFILSHNGPLLVEILSLSETQEGNADEKMPQEVSLLKLQFRVSCPFKELNIITSDTIHTATSECVGKSFTF